MKPTVPRGLTGKANTQDPIEVITDPNTHIEIFDKDGQLIGTGDTDQNGHAFITPIKPIPEGNVTIKATDHVNIQIAQHLIQSKLQTQRHLLYLK